MIMRYDARPSAAEGFKWLVGHLSSTLVQIAVVEQVGLYLKHEDVIYILDLKGRLKAFEPDKFPDVPEASWGTYLTAEVQAVVSAFPKQEAVRISVDDVLKLLYFEGEKMDHQVLYPRRSSEG